MKIVVVAVMKTYYTSTKLFYSIYQKIIASSYILQYAFIIDGRFVMIRKEAMRSDSGMIVFKNDQYLVQEPGTWYLYVLEYKYYKQSTTRSACTRTSTVGSCSKQIVVQDVGVGVLLVQAKYRWYSEHQQDK